MKRLLICKATLAATGCFLAARAEHGQSGAGTSHSPQFTNGGGSHATPKTSSPGSGPANRTTISLDFFAHHANLASRLQPLLPAGATLQSASGGFKNEGQFIAALHVSHNLNIPFDQLKTEMTGASHESLGHAIEDLRPTLSSKAVKSSVKTAEQQTKIDLKDSDEANESATETR